MANSFKLKLFSETLQDIKAYIIANQDKITDFNDGSVITTLVEAFSEEIAQIYNRVDSGFKKYLIQLALSVFDFQQKEGLPASVGLTFSRTISTPDPVSIPAGTIVSDSAGIYFETTAGGTIPANQTDSNLIQAQAQNNGLEGNVPADTITIITTPVPGVDTVTNPNPSTGGQDDETDFEYATRFSEFLLGLGGTSNYGIITEAKKVDGVRSASTIDHSPPLSGLYHLSLYIDDGTGSASTDLVDAVKSRIYGDGTATNPGKKGGGITMRILAPTKIATDVTIEVEDSGIIAFETVENNVKLAITNYMNSLLIGEEFVLYKMIAAVMAVRGVNDVVVTAPLANITPGTDSIIRAGTITVTRS